MRLTASRLGIARYCGWALRDDTTYPERPRGDDAKDGDTLHSCIARECCGEHGVEVPHELEPLFVQAIRHLKQYGVLDVVPEVSFAWDPRTGKARRLGKMLERKYERAGALPHEIVGTVDYLVVQEDRVVIGDWKMWFTSHVTPAEENAQLAFGALCAAQVYGVKKATVEIVGLESHKTDLDRHELRWLDLARWDAEFRRIVSGLPGSPATAGGYCTWCPALGACPATEQTLPAQQLVHLTGKRPQWTTNALGFDNDVLMVQNLPALKKAVEAVEDSIKARYPNGIELDNGKTWAPVKSKRSTFNKEKALQILGHRAAECEGSIEVTSWRQVNTKK